MTNLITKNIYAEPMQYNPQQTEQNPNNFGAIDINAISQDTAQLTQKAGEQIKENWFFKMLRKTFGVKDPKKTTISIALTVATVVGCAILGNKLSDKTADLGLKVDEKILGKKGGSIFSKIGKGLSKAKSKIGKFLKKSKTINDISDTLKNRHAKPKADLTRGYGRGFVSIFSLTPVDIMNKAFAKDKAAFAKALKEGNVGRQTVITKKIQKSIAKLVGDGKAKEFTEQILGISKDKLENREFCSKLTEAIKEHFGCGDNKRKLLDVLKGIKSGNVNGVDVSEFTNVNMKGGGFIASWFPVNIINKIISAVKGSSNFGRGRLGDSLIKFNAVNGTLADTKLGQLAQKVITVPTESISNFVNDKSGMGLLLCGSMIGTYNNAQDAPKNKKVATVADDFVGTIGSIAISTPLAFKTTYGLASLSNLKGNSIITKGLKKIGNIFSMGLDKVAANGSIIKNTSKMKGLIGGGLRFAAIMFVFSSLFSKPIKAGIHKVFGKPYTGAEAQQTEQQYAQQPMQQYAQQPMQQMQQPVQQPIQIPNMNPQMPSQEERYIPSVSINQNRSIDNSKPLKPQENDQIPAFNLFKKKEKTYIPTIEQPALDTQAEDVEIQKQVNATLRKTDNLIKQTRKYL